MTLKRLGFAVLLAGFVMVIVHLHGCAGLLPPTDAQLTTCVGILDAQLKAGQIGPAAASTYQAQMKGQPPVLPMPCVGRV